ncbi:hypothetical protein ABZ388_06855 [Micromonospora parva]
MSDTQSATHRLEAIVMDGQPAGTRCAQCEREWQPGEWISTFSTCPGSS